MKKLNQKKIRWIIREMDKGERSVYRIAKTMDITPRWVRGLYQTYQKTKQFPFPQKPGRKPRLVSIEERIEKGRAQKVYSITKRGRQSFEETQKEMKKQMMKNFTQLLSFAQMVVDIENIEESEILQKRICAFTETMRSIQLMIMLLAKEAPKETETIIEDTLTSLKNLAKEFDIKLFLKQVRLLQQNSTTPILEEIDKIIEYLNLPDKERFGL